MGSLKKASFKIPKKNILSSLFTLKEAQTSSCIEGIETTNEDLFGFTYGNIKSLLNECLFLSIAVNAHTFFFCV